jgi:hypothetical protein
VLLHPCTLCVFIRALTPMRLGHAVPYFRRKAQVRVDRDAKGGRSGG